MLKKVILCFVLFFTAGFHTAKAAQSPLKAPSILIISCSLNPESRGAVIASNLNTFLHAKGYASDLIDLRSYNLPLANGHDQSAYQHAQVKEIHDRIYQAKGIIIISPIYNYNVAATTKNLVELTGHPYKDILTADTWNNKVIGFIGTSGTHRSMMAPFGFLNGMMIDFKILVTPSLVVVSNPDFDSKNQLSAELKSKIEAHAFDVIQLTKAVSIK